MIKFLQEINKLKSIKRTGWLRKNVKNPESVADHSFRVALMAYLLCPDNLDKERMIKMALLNDLPEAVTGDMRNCNAGSSSGRIFVSSSC